MRRDLGYDYLAKLLIIGDSGVGKTNILLRFCENNFLTSHLTTIGISTIIKESTSKLKPLRLITKKLDCRYGIQQASKDSKLLHKLITKDLWAS